MLILTSNCTDWSLAAFAFVYARAVAGTQYLAASVSGGVGGLSQAEQNIFNMTEEERLKMGSAVRDGVLNMDQVMPGRSAAASPPLFFP